MVEEKQAPVEKKEDVYLRKSDLVKHWFFGIFQ